MGTVTKSIGSAGGRDYSTLQAWEDALPANLVTDGNAQVGECYNDSEFAVGSGGSPVLLISGQTTDTTNTITLKCATGQSFRDNANVQTNALKYNVSNGVGIRKTNNYVNAVEAASNNVKFHGLQVKHDGTASTSNAAIKSSGTNCTVDFCILDATPVDATFYAVLTFFATGALVRNSLIISRATSGSDGIRWDNTNNTLGIYNCTIVRCSDKSASTSSGVLINYNSAANGTMKNTAIFGFSEVCPSGKTGCWTSASNNASDQSIGFGSSNQASLTYTSQFVTNGTVSTTQDWKPVSTGSLDDNGVTDSTNGANDIAGTARPSGSAYDIGCWELVQAAASKGIPLFQRPLRFAPRPTRY